MRTIFFACIFLQLHGHAQENLEVKSQVSLPIEISFKKLEDITNASLPKDLYKDTSYEDNENDQLKCSVYKNGAIKITPVKANLLKIDVPLKVWIAKGIGTLGYYNYQSTNFQMVMSFYMAYNIHSNWTLVTKTVKNGYTWIQKPTLNIKGVEIPITKLVELILDNKQQDYANLIDNQIRNHIVIKKDVATIWAKMSEPTMVSEEYKSWLVIKPIQINCLPISSNATALNLKFVVDIIAATYVGNLPTPNPTELPAFKISNSSSDQFSLYTSVYLPYSEATAIAVKSIQNREFTFQDGKYKVKVEDITISHIDSNILIETQMSGSFNGKLSITGIPYYDTIRQSIRLRNLDYNIQTRNILHKVASWLFDKKILTKLHENFEIPIADNLNKTKLTTESALNQEKNGLKISGKIRAIRPYVVQPVDDNIILIILTEGNLKVSI
jgi:hypothetical protein